MSLVPDTADDGGAGDPFGGLLGGMFGGLAGMLGDLPDPAEMAAASAEQHREHMAKLDELAGNMAALAASVETLCALLGPLARLVEHPGVSALLDGKSIGAAMTKGGAK